MSDEYPFATDLEVLERQLADLQLADTLSSAATLLASHAPDADDRVKEAFRQLAVRHPNILEQMHARLTHSRLVRARHLPN